MRPSVYASSRGMSVPSARCEAATAVDSEARRITRSIFSSDGTFGDAGSARRPVKRLSAAALENARGLARGPHELARLRAQGVREVEEVDRQERVERGDLDEPLGVSALVERAAAA